MKHDTSHIRLTRSRGLPFFQQLTDLIKMCLNLVWDYLIPNSMRNTQLGLPVGRMFWTMQSTQRLLQPGAAAMEFLFAAKPQKKTGTSARSLSRFAEQSIKDFNHQSSIKLLRYAATGDIQNVRECLRNGASVYYTDHVRGFSLKGQHLMVLVQKNNTALHYGAANGHFEVVKALLGAGACRTAKNKVCVQFKLKHVVYAYSRLAKPQLIVHFCTVIPTL